MRITAENLACERGGRQVFANLGFAVGKGELLQLVGPNGSGKSTLLKLLAGLIPATAGTMNVEGGDAELSLGQQAHYVSHGDAFKPALTVRENLDFWGRFLGNGSVDAALKATNLGKTAEFPAAYLSAGQRRRLALARLALVHRPVWLLDEPNVGIDDTSQKQLQALMQNHLSHGGIIIAATHITLGFTNASNLRLGAPA